MNIITIYTILILVFWMYFTSMILDFWEGIGRVGLSRSTMTCLWSASLQNGVAVLGAGRTIDSV